MARERPARMVKPGDATLVSCSGGRARGRGSVTHACTPRGASFPLLCANVRALVVIELRAF